MTLLERELCAVVACPCDRVEGSRFCGSAGRGHLGDAYAGRLVALPDGTYADRMALGFVPAWRRRALAKDFSGGLAS